MRPKNAHADILPLPIGGQEAGPYCVEAEDQEEQSEENNEEESAETPCQFVTLYGMNSIYCSSNNMDTSNSLLLTTLNSMRFVQVFSQLISRKCLSLRSTLVLHLCKHHFENHF